MKTLLKRFFAPDQNGSMTSVGLLILRVWIGLTMMIHGWQKLSNFKEMAAQFPSIIPIGPEGNVALTVFAEFFCAIFIAVGFLTRFSALMLVITMAVAFFVAHKGALSGEQSGELAFIYMAGFAALLFTGPGRFSIDALLFSNGAKTR